MFLWLCGEFSEGQGQDKLNERVEENMVQGAIYLMHRVKGTENCHMPN